MYISRSGRVIVSFFNHPLTLTLTFLYSTHVNSVLCMSSTGCPNSGNINSTSGVISSPSYPSSYPGNSKCVWKISAPAGYVIKLVFTRIDLGYCSPCTQCDYVELSNSQNFDTDVIWRRCGSKASYQIFSTGQEFWVKFVSDMSIESWREGFHASYTMIPKDKRKSFENSVHLLIQNVHHDIYRKFL